MAVPKTPYPNFHPALLTGNPFHSPFADCLQFEKAKFELPPGKPLTLASYEAGREQVAYLEFVAVGDAQPDMSLFLRPGYYVPAPLEATYQATWELFPAPLKGLLE